MGKFTEITDRIEAVRTRLGMNKSEFSAKMGIKPQTYNNFVGKQGSKPNMDLFYGIVREFNVDPMWLLNGFGEPFSEGGIPEGDDASGSLSNEDDTSNGSSSAHPASGNCRDSRSKRRLIGPARYTPGTIGELRRELDLLLSASEKECTPILNSDGISDGQVDHAINVLVHRFWIQPAETAAATVRMLEEFRLICDDIQTIDSCRQGVNSAK